MNSDGPHRLCCLILTTGEEAALSRTLESTAFADQRVIAVDPEYPPPINALAAAIPVLAYAAAAAAITAPWTLILFAGDVPSAALAEECHTVCTADSPQNTFAISLESYFLNHRMRFGGLTPRRETRLLRTELVRDFLLTLHADPSAIRCSVVLSVLLIHQTAFSIQTHIADLNDVTSLEAGAAVRRDGRNAPHRPSFVLASCRTFVNVFIRRQGFRDGIYGFLHALYAAVRILLTAAKKWEYARALAAATELPPATPADLLQVKRLG